MPATTLHVSPGCKIIDRLHINSKQTFNTDFHLSLGYPIKSTGILFNSKILHL